MHKAVSFSCATVSAVCPKTDKSSAAKSFYFLHLNWHFNISAYRATHTAMLKIYVIAQYRPTHKVGPWHFVCWGSKRHSIFRLYRNIRYVPWFFWNLQKHFINTRTGRLHMWEMLLFYFFLSNTLITVHSQKRWQTIISNMETLTQWIKPSIRTSHTVWKVHKRILVYCNEAFKTRKRLNLCHITISKI